MKARALGEVLSLPIPSRFAVLSQGLELLVEHVSTLTESVHALTSQTQVRAAAIVASVAAEESAKALILADLARLGWTDQSAARRQIKYFYQHVPRGIYAEMVSMRPAGFREVRGLVEMYRPSRFLDGPNDLEWIFRNRIEQAREETLYVDFVADDEGTRWVSPGDNDGLSLSRQLSPSNLILAMSRLGVFTTAGLDATCAVWQGVAIDDRTDWSEIARLNRQVLEAVGEAGGIRAEATAGDVSRVEDQWGFPLSGLDLTRLEVTDKQLELERKGLEDRFWKDEYGSDYANDW